VQQVGDRWSPAGHALIVQQSDTIFQLLDLFYFIFWNLEEVGGWMWHFGRMRVKHPHYLKLALTLGSVQSSIPHGNWRFHLFL
jgi:hypothetical protein